MTAKDVIRNSFGTSDMTLHKYVDDLTDDELRLRPIEGMNPIAWQIGHLIGSERWFVEQVEPGSSPPLPEGFEAGHPRQPAEADESKFLTKEGYFAAWKAQREATLAVLDRLPESRLDEPGPEPIRSFVPTIGALLNLAGLHPLMHAGQFVAVRRKLGKPIAF